MARKNRLQLGLTLDFSAKSEKVEDSDFVHLMYRIVASASPSRFEAHAGLFRLLMKGISNLMYCDLLTKS